MNNWLFRNTEPLNKQQLAGIKSVAATLNLSEEIIRLLFLRGIREENVREYLDPGLRYLQNPDKWPGILDAAKLIVRCLQEGKKTAVWGDYDVDGVTSTVLVLEVLRFYGYNIKWHLPSRQTEGYGLNKDGIEELYNEGIEVLITVDCGISDVKEIQYAKEKGMTVIVSDHHIPPEILPPADIICNPRLSECPCADLAGVGVAFFLMAAVNSILAVCIQKKYDIRKSLDLVALGTLADLVKLEGQNRILAKNGLIIMQKGERPGIRELLNAAKMGTSAKLEADNVVFGIAPRLNAAGRLASAQLALHLLNTDDLTDAASLADQLNQYNTQRRTEEDIIAREALKQAEEQNSDAALIIAGTNWNFGVLGIVASRVVEKFNKPTFVIARDGDTWKGSGRSIRQFDLHAALTECAECFEAFGGHKMAAGIQVKDENLDAFRKKFNKIALEKLGEKPIPSEIYLDDDLDFKSAADFLFIKELDLMQPFGIGNPEPLFRSPILLVKMCRIFGKNRQHIRVKLTDEKNGITLEGIAWRMADRFTAKENERIVIAYTPYIDNFGGEANIALKIKDWKYPWELMDFSDTNSTYA